MVTHEDSYYDWHFYLSDLGKSFNCTLIISMTKWNAKLGNGQKFENVKKVDI